MTRSTEQLKNYMRSVDVNQNDVLLGCQEVNSRTFFAFEYAKLFGGDSLYFSRGSAKAKDVADINVVIPGQSSFPGQRGKNDNNFHIEDFKMRLDTSSLEFSNNTLEPILRCRLTGPGDMLEKAHQFSC